MLEAGSYLYRAPIAYLPRGIRGMMGRLQPFEIAPERARKPEAGTRGFEIFPIFFQAEKTGIFRNPKFWMDFWISALRPDCFRSSVFLRAGSCHSSLFHICLSGLPN